MLNALIRAAVLGTGAGLTGARLGREDRRAREREDADRAFRERQYRDRQFELERGRKMELEAERAKAQQHRESYEAARSRLGDHAGQLGDYSPTTDYDSLSRWLLEEMARDRRAAEDRASRERAARIRASSSPTSSGGDTRALSSLNQMIDDQRQLVGTLTAQIPKDRPELPLTAYLEGDDIEARERELTAPFVRDSTAAAARRDSAQARLGELQRIRDSVAAQAFGLPLLSGTGSAPPAPAAAPVDRGAPGPIDDTVKAAYAEAAEAFAADVAAGMPEAEARRLYDMALMAITQRALGGNQSTAPRSAAPGADVPPWMQEMGGWRQLQQEVIRQQAAGNRGR